MTDFINTIIFPGLSAGALYALIATGFTVLYRTTGVINFAHGELVMLAPLGVLVATEKLHLDVWLGFVLATLVVCMVALVEERIAIRPFLRSGHSLPWILSTLGVSVLLAELLAIPFQGQARAFKHGAGTTPWHFGGLRISPADVVIIGVAITLVAALYLFYTRTRAGMMLEAMADDIDGAAAIGISARRMSQLSALLAGIVALITGFVIAPTQLVYPSLGLSYTFNGFVAAALGGMGNLIGGLVGGFLVGFLIQISSVYFGSLLVNVTLFAALLGVYLIRPYGLLGRPPVRVV
jgi:branched-chain amino acid transport system permease protein